MDSRRWVIVRHAPAMSRDYARWPDDRGRPLKPAGKREFEEASEGLVRLLSPEGHLCSSPLARAHQTASILENAWGEGHGLEHWTELEPEGSIAATFQKARLAKGRGDLVLVGHEPHLSRFVGYCLSGEEFSAVRFSKGGAVGIDFPGSMKPGGGRILWALTRGQARRLASSRSKVREDE